MSGFIIVEASGDLYRRWFYWSRVHQSLLEIRCERMGREEMVTTSRCDSFENFAVKVYSEMEWLIVGVQSQGQTNFFSSPFRKTVVVQKKS